MKDSEEKELKLIQTRMTCVLVFYMVLILCFMFYYVI